MYLNPLRPQLTSGSRNEFKINLLKRQILPIKIKTLAKSGYKDLSNKKFSGVSRLGITKGESGRSCIPVSEPHRIAGECGYHIF